MIPNRIEAYCDLSGFAYLREYQGSLAHGSSKSCPGIVAGGGNDEPVIVAEEFNGDGQIVRTWFVMFDSHRDGMGISPKCQLPHTIVSRDIRPGEPSAPYDPNSPVTLGSEVRADELKLIKAQRDEWNASRKCHVVYSQTYLDALKNAEGWKSNVENLNTVVAQKDATIKERNAEIFELKNEAALNRLQIATLQASYSALENQKSFWYRTKAWLRAKLKRFRKLFRRGR